MEDAKEAYVQMLRSYPDLTVSRLRQTMVFSPVFLDRMVGNLRKQGCRIDAGGGGDQPG